jgi:outer membrane protein assembly factor BamE
MNYLLILFTILLVSCSSFRFPGVHRINVQQGNVISQAMVDKLKPGMTKSQVRFILGNPVIDDSLNRDRWDYIYTMQVAGGEHSQRILIVHFREDLLSYFEGDYLPSDQKDANPV